MFVQASILMHLKDAAEIWFKWAFQYAIHHVMRVDLLLSNILILLNTQNNNDIVCISRFQLEG